MAAEERTAVSAAGSAEGRILLVEDDELLRETLNEVLADEGYLVRAAVHGADALDQMEAWTPELIILDLMMPVMDAFEFRRQQKQRGLAPDAPVLVLSAARELGQAASSVAAAAYLAKPFHLDEVLRTVGDLLERHRTPGAAAR